MDRSCGETHVPIFVPRLGLIKPGQEKVCPQLYENDSLDYFEILGELSSGLS